MLLIVSLGMAMAVPSLSDWQEERQLDLAAEELASAIREAETEARSETSPSSGSSSSTRGRPTSSSKS